ncbi:DUF1080 domain-containing protein [Bacteroidales bacterium OttesenSCG-928-M11]|nr:DUF1080 domain-containing protein [Bacteroidales bacterium OttesenSCG-928-M11]
MKKILYLFLLTILCYSCSDKTDGYIVFETNESSCWNIQGQVERSEKEIVLKGNKSKAITTTSYRDFILEFECKTSPDAIGGVVFHSNGYDSQKRGYEVLINNNQESEEWRKTGSLSAIRNYGKCLSENDTWVKMRIEVEGSNIKVHVGDYWVVDYSQPKNPYRQNEYKGRLLSKGVFVFANYSEAPIAFRNIKVKPLDAIPFNKTDAINEDNDEFIRLHQKNFPLFDTNIQLVDSLTPDSMDSLTRKYGITYGVVALCGTNSAISTDKQVDEWFDRVGNHLFLLGMKAEGSGWQNLFSQKSVDRFDYVLTDALTWTESVGQTNIVSNLNFLTEEIITACVENQVAIEINCQDKIPNIQSILLAKESGVHFSFAMNNKVMMNRGEDNQLDYPTEVIKSCELEAKDIYIPLAKINR